MCLFPEDKKTAFSTNGADSIGGHFLEECKYANMQIYPFLSPCTKLKPKWIKDLHIKPDTLTLIEEKLGKNLKHMSTGEIFLNRTPMAYVLRS